MLTQQKNEQLEKEVIAQMEETSLKNAESISSSSDSEQEDVALEETVELKEASDILGLRCNTTRNLLNREPSIRCIDYGIKRVWIKKDILNFK